MAETNHTTHYSVVDPEGNAVATTTTLNDTLGSRVTAEGLGFLMNDEMDDFASKPGVPNMYGLIQGPANAMGPGKRPLSAMTPTIVLKDGKLFLVLGSPGGPRIITTVANILMGVIDYGMNIQEAVDAQRFHQQWLPDTSYLEEGFSPEIVKALEGMGHHIEFGEEDYGVRDPSWSDGECIMVDPKRGDPPGRQRQAQWRQSNRILGLRRGRCLTCPVERSSTENRMKLHGRFLSKTCRALLGWADEDICPYVVREATRADYA